MRVARACSTWRTPLQAKKTLSLLASRRTLLTPAHQTPSPRKHPCGAGAGPLKARIRPRPCATPAAFCTRHAHRLPTRLGSSFQKRSCQSLWKLSRQRNFDSCVRTSVSKKTDRSPDVNPHNFRYKRGWFCEWCETVYRKREEDDSLRSQQNLPDDLFWVGCESCDRWCHLRCERANDPDGLIFGNAVPMTHAPESMDFVAIPERLKFHCAKCRDDQERTERDPKWTTASNSLAAGAEVRHGVLAHFRPFLRVDSSVDVTGITGVNTSVTGAATGSVSRRRSLPRTRCISEIAPTRCKSGKGTRKRETFALDPGKKDAAGLNDTASTIVTVAKEVDPSLFNDGPPAKKRKPSKSRSKSKSSSKAGESASSDTVTATVDKTLAASVAELVSPTPRRPRSRSTRATATALRAKKEPAVTPKVSQPVVPQIDSLAFPSPVAGIASLPKSPLEMLKAQAGQVETRLQETKRFGKPQAPASPVLPSTISPPARGGMG